MPLSFEQFWTHLAESNLIDAADLHALIELLPADRRPKDGEELARELVRQAKLTAFQAHQIYAGKGKSLLLGNYVIQDKLGQGGMGMVLKAEHQRMKRTVALKVLSPTVIQTPELVSRFQREVQAAARLTHPNIVAAFDADEFHGTHYLVIEYVDGSDLSAIVKKKGPLSINHAVNCVLQAAQGLEFAHSQGVIHRDIKPANLLLDSKGTVKILDMGLARIEGDSGAQAELTQTGTVMGTVDYMAPEQALSTKTADARSDIYSLGVTLWFVLVARPVYSGDTLMARLVAHREFPVPSLCSVRDDVPPSLDAIFQRMVAKHPADRFQSMTEVIAALQACLRGEAIETPTFATGPSEDSRLSEFLAETGATMMSELAPGAHPRKEMRFWYTDLRVQLGGGVLAICLLAGLFAFGPSSQPVAPEPAAPTDIPGTPEKQSAGSDKLPRTPFDDFDHAQVPQDELAVAGGGNSATAPRELVAVLGDSRWVHYPGSIVGIAFSPDGTRVISYGNRVIVWDVSTGRAVRHFGNFSSARPIRDAAFTPDGTRLFLAVEKGLVVMDTATWNEIPSSLPPLKDVTSLACSRDGSSLVTSSKPTGAAQVEITVWNLATRQVRQTIAVDAQFTTSLALSADGELLAGTTKGKAGNAGSVTCWNLKNGQTLFSHNYKYTGSDVAFHPNGQVLAYAEGYNGVSLFDTRSGKELQRYPGGYGSLDYSPDGKLLAARGNPYTTVWDTETGRELVRQREPTREYVTFSPQGQRLATASRTGIEILDGATGKTLTPLSGHCGYVLCVTVSSDGKTVVTCGADGRFRVWSAEDGWKSRELPFTEGWADFCDVALSPDGTYIASAFFRSLHLRKFPSGDSIVNLPSYGNCRLSFSFDGARLATSAGPEVTMIDSLSGSILFKTKRSDSSGMALSPDGKYMVTGAGPATIDFLDATTGQLNFRIRHSSAPANAFAFSADGQSLYSAHAGSPVRVWNVLTGKQRSILQQSYQWKTTTALACTADGRWIVGQSGDQAIVVWNAGTREIEHEFDLSAVKVLDFALSPEGRHVITANTNGTSYVLRLENAPDNAPAIQASGNSQQKLP